MVDSMMANTASTTSSMTSTSHTMTAFPPPASKNPSSANPSSLKSSAMTDFRECLAPGKRHEAIQPTPLLVKSSLDFVKETLDALAGTLGEEQTERQKQLRRKRKRGEEDVGDVEILRIRRIYTD